MTPEQWNKRFSELNGIPVNNKIAPAGYNSYLRQIMRDKPDHYKNPDDYPSTPAPAPSVTPAPAPTASGANNELQSILFNAKVLLSSIEAAIAKQGG